MNPAGTAGRTWDAVVVGAGPAGAVAARELARRGAAVLLVDKARFPRPKVCGCCLNGAAVAALKGIGLGHVLEESGAVPLRNVRLASGRTSAALRLPGGYALSRDILDPALIREAEKAGATFLPATVAKVDEADAEFRRVRLTPARQGDECVAARVVVLASGLAGSTTPSRLAPGSRLGAGAAVSAATTPAFYTPGTVYMATGRGGYVGLVRVEDGRLDIGAAFDPEFVRASGGLGSAAGAILGATDWPAVPGLAALPWKGTPALTRRPEAVAARRLFAVGDAAGYVEPFTGEGMAWAVASAAALAPIAFRAAAAWDDDYVRDWRRAHALVVGRRQGVCRAAARVLRSPALTRLAVRTLSLAPFLSRPVVAALNRPPAPLHGLPA